MSCHFQELVDSTKWKSFLGRLQQEQELFLSPEEESDSHSTESDTQMLQQFGQKTGPEYHVQSHSTNSPFYSEHIFPVRSGPGTADVKSENDFGSLVARPALGISNRDASPSMVYDRRYQYTKPPRPVVVTLDMGSDLSDVEVNIKNKFKWTWLDELDKNGDLLREYVQKTDQPGEAFCAWCKDCIKYGSSGKKTIHSHASSVKHAKARSAFVY